MVCDVMPSVRKNFVMLSKGSKDHDYFVFQHKGECPRVAYARTDHRYRRMFCVHEGVNTGQLLLAHVLRTRRCKHRPVAIFVGAT